MPSGSLISMCFLMLLGSPPLVSVRALTTVASLTSWRSVEERGLLIVTSTPFAALPSSRAIPPILHYSAAEPFTKYEMCLIFAKILGVPHGHIIADAEAPKVCFAQL